jgi:glyoxylase-like metal-dependent hydrolase (beta-lactamase superfamily II)
MSERRRARFEISHDYGFVEVADRCWVARHEFLDVNVGVVAGERGLLVVDTHASEADARGVLEAVRRLGVGDVVAVVNTHEHFDHVLGNAVFAEEYAEAALLAHETAAERMPEAVERVNRLYAEDPADPHASDVLASRLVVPGTTFSSARVVDLGDRIVELVHPGRGHTGGDVVVRVGDADVLYAGDLVEESAARTAVPGFGDDCYPLEWPVSLDLVTTLLTPESVVVPGHGNPVDREFVMLQRADIGVVAETIRDLAGKGVRPRDMAAAAEWPYPVEELADAFTRGFAQLPRSSISLPLA